jgi:hypothetical protein
VRVLQANCARPDPQRSVRRRCRGCCAHNMSLQPETPTLTSWATPDPPLVLLLRFRLGTGCTPAVGAGGRRSGRRPTALGALPLPWCFLQSLNLWPEKPILTAGAPLNPPLVQRLTSTRHRLYASWARAGDVWGVGPWREGIRSSWLLLLLFADLLAGSGQRATGYWLRLLHYCMQHPGCSACAALS